MVLWLQCSPGCGARHRNRAAASGVALGVLARRCPGSTHNQEELRSVCQGQEETVRMVWGSQMESTQSTCKGKKPIYTFTKKGNENQSVFSDQVVEPVALAKRAKEDLDEEVGWAMVVEYEDDALALNLKMRRKWRRRVSEHVVTCCGGVEAGNVTPNGMETPLLGNNLENPELRRLAQSLPAKVLRSRADTTTKKYLGAYQRWKIWADTRQGVPSFPVPDLHLVLYVQHLSGSTESKAAVEEAVHAISWVHGLAGLQPVKEGHC
ncbi:hypothetical protein EMCRGX_G011906 [Ephydatia muelleri]